jgi:dipeptidyl aminopeptidase/acylaminoacyl peptidase
MGPSKNLLGPEPSEDVLQLMITHTQVNKQTPPTLLVHSKDDNEVPFKNSELFYEALQKNGIKSKLLGYEKGRHAYAMGRRGTDSAAWPGECLKWFAEIGVIPAGDMENFFGTAPDSFTQG